MKVSELTGAELDYWVAKADGVPEDAIGWSGGFDGKVKWERCLVGNYGFCPSRNWEHGGPIIERERIMICGCVLVDYGWTAFVGTPTAEQFEDEHAGWENGPTPLVAAMRAFVASRLGPEVPDAKEQ